jgi:hypothetical protein
VDSKNIADGKNFMGMEVFSHGLNSKFSTNFAIPIFDCIIPNRPPMPEKKRV